MQQRLLEQRVAHRLKPLTVGQVNFEDDSEDMFKASLVRDLDDDFMFHSDEEDMCAEDDALFEGNEELEWFESGDDDDLFDSKGCEYETLRQTELEEEGYAEDLFSHMKDLATHEPRAHSLTSS